MSETDTHPVRLTVRVTMPNSDTVAVRIPLDATVGQFRKRALRGVGIKAHHGTALTVPLPTEDGDHQWHTIDDEERLIDALRGVQRTPRIMHTDADSFPDNE